MSSSSLTTIASHFEGCTATDGGAIYASAGSSIDLIGSSFVVNQAKSLGGAIFAQRSTVDFRSEAGAVKATVQITGNGSINTSPMHETGSTFNQLFVSNTASSGGSIYLYDYANLLLKGTIVLFKNNSANSGGGIHIYGNSAVKADTT